MDQVLILDWHDTAVVVDPINQYWESETERKKI